MERMLEFQNKDNQPEVFENSLEKYRLDIMEYVHSEVPNEELLNNIATNFVLNTDEEAFWDEEKGSIEDLQKQISSYTEEFIDMYKNGNFTQKSRIVDLLTLMYAKSKFTSNSVSMAVIKNTVNNLFDIENNEKGNYFVSLYIKNILEGDNSSKTEKVVKISPDQYLIHKEQGYSISKKEDQELVLSTYKEFKDLEGQLENSYKNQDSLLYKKLLDQKLDLLKKLELLFPNRLSDINERFQNKSKKNLSNSISDLAFFTNNNIESTIHKEIGFSLNELSLQEQFYFLEYIKEINNSEASLVFSFANKYGIDGIKTFLSLEHEGRDIGDTILNLSNTIPQEDAKKIFEQYSKIVNSTNKVIDFLVKKYEKEDTDLEIVEKVQNTLLEKGTKLLKDISGSVKNKEISEEVVRLLSQYEEDILLFASTFKTLSEKDRDLSLEDVVGTEIQKLNKKDIEFYKNDLISINKDNRKEFMSQEELLKRTNRLVETFKKDNVEFYGATFEGKLISFISFEKQKDGSLLAESLNVAPSIKQSHIGNAFFETLIKDLGEENDIYGYVHKKNSDKLSFYEKLGFVVTPIVKDDGSEWYMIRYHTKVEESKLAA